jgi:hypothetical protein
MATSVGPDGIDVSGYAWTNQSSTFHSNLSLESGGPAASGILNAAERYGYGAWTYDPAVSLAAGISISTTTYVSAIYVPQSFTVSTVDWVQVSGTPNVTVGLWATTAPAGVTTPLAYGTAAAATAAALNSQALSASVNLIGGNTYLVSIFGSTTGVVSCLTSVAAAANVAVGAPYTVSTTYRAGTLASGQVTYPLTGSSVLGTSTLSADYIWFGLH